MMYDVFGTLVCNRWSGVWFGTDCAEFAGGATEWAAFCFPLFQATSKPKFLSRKMIQRIQSIYLFLAALVLASPVFLPLPLAKATGDPAALLATGENFFADGTYWVKEFPGGMSLLFAAAFSLYAIFLYKNRPRQMRLAAGMAILTVLLAVLFAALGFMYASQLPAGTQAQLAVGSGFPIVAVPLLLLAYRAIKKDEALVRSSERLR